MRRASEVGTRHVWLFRSLWLAIIGIGLAFRTLQSSFYIFGSDYDDELMVRMAKGFLQGHWSSTWASTGSVTLTKPVGFPLFLAGAHFVPMSPLVTEYVVFVVGAWLVAWAWRRMSRSRVQATVVLAALVLNPVFFAYDSQRIYRDVFIDDVAMLAIGITFVAAGMLQGRIAGPGAVLERWRYGRHSAPRPGRRSTWVLVGMAVVVGLLTGLTAVTKENWQWLPIALAAPLAYPLVRALHLSVRRWRVLLLSLVAILVFAIGVFGVVDVTKTMNQRTYGVSVVDDFSAGAFARTWDLWAGVQAGAPRRYVPVTRPMRLAVYRVSPRARELAPFLESPDDFWKKGACVSALHICGESAALFEWDLRAAADATGRIHSVRGIQTFFAGVARDIAAGCRTGRLHCSSSPVLATGLPPLNRVPVGPTAWDTVDGLWQMLWNQVPIHRLAGVNDNAPSPAQYRLWNSVVPSMPPRATAAEGTRSAWLYSTMRVIDRVYGVGNVVLFAVLLFGLCSLVIRRTGRRRAGRFRIDRQAASLSSLLFLSTLYGIGVLAVFQAAQWPGFILPLYWVDFSAPAELALVFGAFACWPVLRSWLRARTSASAGGSPIPEPHGPAADELERRLAGTVVPVDMQ